MALALGLLASVSPPGAEAKRLRCPAGMASVRGKFCIDRFEASVDVVNSRGATVRRHSPYHRPSAGQRLRARSRKGVVPQAYLSQREAATACEAAGKRLCTDAEWKEACKGRTPTAYPYGKEHVEGYCNDSGTSPLRKLHGKDDSVAAFGIKAMNDPKLNQLPDTVAKTGRFKRCRNSFGLHDMVGNLHEWTANPGGVFRGGYYLDTTENGEGCAYVTTGHDTKYHDYSIGFRCCKGGPNDAIAKRRRAKQKASEARSRARRPQKVHVVAAGETLGKIARRHRTTIEAICELNGIRRNAVIRPGQELKIPKR